MIGACIITLPSGSTLNRTWEIIGTCSLVNTKHWNRRLSMDGDTMTVALVIQYVVLEFTVILCMCVYTGVLE